MSVTRPILVAYTEISVMLCGTTVRIATTKAIYRSEANFLQITSVVAYVCLRVNRCHDLLTNVNAKVRRVNLYVYYSTKLESEVICS